MDPVTKGARAKDILENEVYQEAVKGATQSIKDRWAATADSREREALWHKLQAIEAVSTELRIIRDRGIVEHRKNEQETT
jgi:hypothetical protein